MNLKENEPKEIHTKTFLNCVLRTEAKRKNKTKQNLDSIQKEMTYYPLEDI